MVSAASVCFASSVSAQEARIIHDAEHYILADQHGERWAAEDIEISAELVEIRERNEGSPPNIIYILIDDVGFGEMGMPELNYVRGYRTPAINKLATQSLSLARMYTEPSCTPTRTAFLTGRIPVRSHMLEPKVVPPEGSGLHTDEVTIAEVLSQAGYNTAHVGKWHQGDIEQAYPHNQGFDVAFFPMHNQATFNLMHDESETEGWAFSISAREKEPDYALDGYFRPLGWVLGLEAEKGGLATEWGVDPGEDLGYEYYRALNERYADLAVEQLERLAGEDAPFFLNYWPQRPVDFGRVGRDFKTANSGSWVESMAEEDAFVGELLDKVDELGIADNTIIVLMGDNGPMRQALGRSGYTDMVYRGFKGESTEGAIRVNAFIRWPGVIEPRSYAGDIVHVSDLYTTLARIAGATEFIPRDRIVDGVDQTAMLLKGDGHSRRDYVHVYEGPNLAATIKQQFKVHWPAPGSPSFKLPVHDLYRDPREERALPVEAMWSVAYFGDMRARHMASKEKYPDRPETTGRPYEGITNLRPETLELVRRYELAKELLNP